MSGNPVIFDVIIGMLLISGISMACVGWYGRRFADRIPAAVPYTLLMLSAAAWAVLYALELTGGSLPFRVFFHNLRFLILPFIPVLELWLVIAFVKKTEWLRKDWAAAVLVIPVAAAVLAITSPYHTWFRYNFSIDTSGPVAILQYSEGPFYSLYFVYSFILLVIAIIILILESRKRGTFWENQTILLLLALAFPTVVNYLFFFGITPVPGINMTPALLWMAAILYTVALFRYRFLDIIPVARSRLIETMGTPMLVLDTGGRIIDLNPAACTLFSITPSVAVGKLVNEISPDWPDFLSLCQSGNVSHADLTRTREEGMHFYTGSIEMIRTPSGEPEARLVLLQEVTDQKQAEEALAESEARLQSILHGSPVLQLVIDRNHRVISWNRALEEYSGIRAAEIIGTDQHWRAFYSHKRPVLADLLIDGNTDGLFKLYAGNVQTSQYIEGAFEATDFFPHMGAHGTWLSFTAAPVQDKAGTIIGAVETLEDITDRKRAGEQREHLIHELEQKNAELDRFASTVAHDLKSPLITIRGFLGLLEEDIRKEDPGTAQADINRISSAAEKMERLIATLLELSRSGRKVDSPVRIPFADLAREAAGLLATQLNEHHVTLVIADNLPEISGDRQRLLQVMTNLLDNTVKFMGVQKEPRVEVGVRTGTGTPVFFVKDNGMGIKKGSQLKVFGLFERFNPDVPGSGIGLATVKRIIEAHGGKIWVESEGEGEGTTMCFTLPGVPPVNEKVPEV